MADNDKAKDAGKTSEPKRNSVKRSVDIKPKAAAKIVPADKKPAPVVTKPAPVATKAVLEPVKPISTAATVSAGPSVSPSVKTWLLRTLIVVLGLFIIVGGVFAVLIYGLGSTSQLTYAVSGVLPFPAERVNGHFVSYHDFLFEVNANQKAYVSNAKLNNQTAVSWSSAEGKKMATQIKQHALTKLEDDVIVSQLASKYKVGVTDKDVNDLINTLYQKYGGKDTLLKTLSQIYGWNLADLKHVIRRQLLSQKVQTAVASDKAIDSQTKTKAQAVLNKIKGGADFATTAKASSQASDASGGGDLGTVAKGQVEDAVFSAATALQPGSLSDVIKTQYGYQILKVIDKTDAGIHLQHILIQNISFTDFMAQQAKTAKVKTFVKTS